MNNLLKGFLKGNKKVGRKFGLAGAPLRDERMFSLEPKERRRANRAEFQSSRFPTSLRQPQDQFPLRDRR
jgi:hypothetical protein